MNPIALPGYATPRLCGNLERARRFELPTNALATHCSTRLSYTRFQIGCGSKIEVREETKPKSLTTIMLPQNPLSSLQDLPVQILPRKICSGFQVNFNVHMELIPWSRINQFWLYVSRQDRPISMPRLNRLLCVHLAPINVIISHGSITIPHLRGGFPLRCFQRLSGPNIATLRCPWQGSRYNRGPFVLVLSSHTSPITRSADYIFTRSDEHRK